MLDTYQISPSPFDYFDEAPKTFDYWSEADISVIFEKSGAAKINNQTTRINADVNAGMPIGSKAAESAANTKEVTMTANRP